MLGDFGDTFSHVLAWFFLPGWVTSFVQSFYYGFRYNRENRPTANSPVFVRDKNRIYILVILAYFFYIWYHLVTSLSPNYYDEMGLSQFELDTKLRPLFRRLSLKYHPDKLVNADEEVTRIAAEKFMHLQRLYETLNDPILRVAYDRFGPIESQDCIKCILFRDFLFNSIWHSVTYYVIVLLVSLVLSLTSGAGTNSSILGSYWRFIVIVGMAILELGLLVAPLKPSTFPNLILGSAQFLSRALWIDGKATFQRIKIFRELTTNLLLAINQIAPLLFGAAKSSSVPNTIRELHRVILGLSKDVNSSVLNILKPFKTESHLKQRLVRRMQKTYVDFALFDSDPEFRKLYQKQLNTNSQVSA